MRPTNPGRRKSLKAINLAKVKSGYSQFGSICTGAQVHTCTHRRSLSGSSFILHPQRRCLPNQQSDKLSHQNTMSPACPTKHCTPSELPENGFCKMKVCLKLLVENSISRSVSRQKILSMLGNEHIQLHLPCIILHKYWIWGLESAFVGDLGKKKKRKTSWSYEVERRMGDREMDQTIHMFLQVGIHYWNAKH